MALALAGNRRGCHGGGASPVDGCARKIALVGNPNVGKSVIFNRLTGAYAVVSNYPGTTVELSRGLAKAAAGNGKARRIQEVIDTPGMYGLLSITDEERVTRRLLLEEKPDLVVHVVDTKNLQRMLSLTLQLIEAGLSVVLDLNIMDEAEKAGLSVNAEVLEREIGVGVAKTSGVLSLGLDELTRRLSGECLPAASPVSYDPAIETAIARISRLLSSDYGFSRRAIALLLLQRDSEIAVLVASREGKAAADIEEAVRSAEASHASLCTAISSHRQERVRQILERCFDATAAGKRRIGETVSRLMIRPLTGVPLLLLVLLGLYWFVGIFGAGTLVTFIEGTLFGRIINPFLVSLFARFVPWKVVSDLFVGDYGVLTLGFRYALAIILPIVGTFFLAFSILEDSGYFPRIALLVDRAFKRIGMNGRAVIPVILGFGCDTMATLVTRTLETRRERVIATLLLALAIPCSAQLGVILALLSRSPIALAIWAFVILAVFLLVGWLSARILPGAPPSFAMELPPLRLPRLGNVLTKTYSRMRWYLREIIPVFLLVSVAVWLGQITGLFQLLIRAMKPVMEALGLPPQAGSAFLFGFFRRDYGAAGLFDLAKQGLLSYRQLLVAAITLTLFIPCVAQFAVMAKERGWKTSVAIVAFIIPFAFAAGFAVDRLIRLTGVLQ